MRTKLLCCLLTICLLFSCTVLTSCSRAPSEEELYDRVVELIEESYALNTVFYGAGLPVYAADSVYADFTHMYYGFYQAQNYEIITEQAAFLSEEEIKQAAERVYSKGYLQDVIYPAIFDGYAIDNGAGDATVSPARYLTDGEYFCRSTQDTDYLTGMRIYDYSTLKVIKPSDAEACTVTLNSWLESDPGAILEVTLRLTLGEDGQWYLDSFTG